MSYTARKPRKVLLDTTYLLPTFGVEVEGLSEEDIAKLRTLLDNHAIIIHYSVCHYRRYTSLQFQTE